MSRLVGWLLVILGAFVAIFYALLPPDPCLGACPGSVVVLLQPNIPPDPQIIALVGVVLGVVGLAFGLLGLARAGVFWTSELLAIVSLYVLVQRFLWSPGPVAFAGTAATYPAPVAWLSLAVGVVSLVVGLIGFVRGDAGAQAAR